MAEFVIEVGADGLKFLDGDDEPLFGNVSFKYQTSSFPRNDWTDLVGSVLSTTSVAMRDIVNGGTDGFTYFFEGPFYVYYRLLSRSDWTVQVEANHEDGEEVVRSVWVAALSIHGILQQALRAADTLLGECGRRAIEGRGVERLHHTRAEIADTMRHLELG